MRSAVRLGEGASTGCRLALRRLAIVGVAAGLAAGLSAAPAFGSALARPAPVTTCPTPALRLVLGPVGSARGHGYAVYDLINATRRACGLEGFPHIGLLRPDGQAVRLRIDRTTGAGYASPAVPKRYVSMSPGSTADFWTEWPERSGRMRGAIEVTPPGQRRSITIHNNFVVLDTGRMDVSPVTATVLSR